MHWHDKSCARCGHTIRYSDEWTHIPNYCKNCREALESERKEKEEKRAAEKATRAEKWKERSCKECGQTIRYNIEWRHIPNYCSDCKEKFRRKREAKSSDEYKLIFKTEMGKNEFLFGSDNPKPHDGHGHVVIGDDGQVHYIRDRFDPKKAGDEKNAESYDDGFFF